MLSLKRFPNSKVFVLGPIEGISEKDQNSGVGYLTKMMKNVEILKIGLKYNNWQVVFYHYIYATSL